MIYLIINLIVLYLSGILFYGPLLLKKYVPDFWKTLDKDKDIGTFVFFCLIWPFVLVAGICLSIISFIEKLTRKFGLFLLRLHNK
jgi:hypothetical protein